MKKVVVVEILDLTVFMEYLFGNQAHLSYL